MMYLETRYYDNGNVEAQLTKNKPATDLEDDTINYDYYIEEIGKDADYESLQEWIGDLYIEIDDIIPFVIDLESGKWVEISAYV